MVKFSDEAHRRVYYPEDRRLHLWIDPRIALGLLACIGVLLAAAWINRIVFGLPYIAINEALDQGKFRGPHGFPGWIRWTHFFNLLFITMLIRSGLSILADHPRLYFNDDCTPGTEWIRFTPLKIPVDKIWTSREDARRLHRYTRHSGRAYRFRAQYEPHRSR